MTDGTEGATATADGGVGDGPDDHPNRREGRGGLRRWVLLDADRRVIAGLLAAGFFLALAAAGAADPSPLAATMTQTDPVESLFQAYVAGIVTGVTLVLTINQLVLSQELGAVGDQRERMDGAMQFRRDAEVVLDEAVSPADPARFVRALLAAVARRAETVGETATGERSEALAGDVAASATAVRNRLAGARFGTFDVVAATLAFDYSGLLHEARARRAEAADADAADALDELATALELYGVTREHFKTLYFQWELIDLSRELLYVSVPALAVASGVLLYLDPAVVPGTTLGASNVVWTVSVASTVAVLPFVILLAYVLRVATVAKRTLAIGPFVLDAADRE